MTKFTQLLVVAFAFFVVNLDRSYGDDYGYLRVKVLKTNHVHSWPVQGYANGRSLGLSFSHATKGHVTVKLKKGHLSKSQSETPLKLKYGPLDQNGCHFEFKIDYSHSGDFSRDRVSLGKYNAPSSTSIQSIPIGLGCSDGEKLCSANRKIQEALDKAMVAEKKDEFEDWKSDLEQELRGEERYLENQAFAGANNRLARTEFGPEGELGGSEEQFEDMVEGLRDELEADEEHSLAEESEQSEAMDPDEVFDEVENQHTELSRRERQEMLDDLYDTGVGSYAAAWVEYDNAVDQFIEQQRLFHEQLKELQADADEIRRAEYLIAEAHWLRTTIANGKYITSVAKEGLRFSPIGDAVDLCEFATGREYCDSGGRELSNSEVVAAGLGVFIGNRKIWSGLKNKFSPNAVASVDRAYDTAQRIGVKTKEGLSRFFKFSKQVPSANKNYERVVNKIADASQNVVPKFGDRYVRELPELKGSYKEAFEGHIFKGAYEPGEILFQAQRTGQKKPGRWFSPIKPIDSQHAEEMLNIAKHSNDSGQLKAFVIKERVSGYAGKIEGGVGHQFYVPDGVPLSEIVEEVKF